MFEDKEEKIYTIDFLGDNTHAELTSKNVCSYQDNYKKYYSLKKKKLKKAILEANDQLIQREKNQKETEHSPSSEKKQDDTEQNFEETKDTKNESVINSLSVTQDPDAENDSKKDHESEELPHLGTKQERKEKSKDDEENLINKISSYLSYITKLIKKDVHSIEKEKECLIKVLEYLKNYRIKKVVEFLEKTHVSKMVKFIIINTDSIDKNLSAKAKDTYYSFQRKLIDDLRQNSKNFYEEK